jgi:predicted aspartyl protease
MRPIFHITDSTPKETPMGKVLTTLTVINRADQIRAKDGTIAAEKVRSVDLVNVLVDTGATTLCLPKEVIEKLGLSVLKEVEVMTAMGIGKARIFEDARLVLCGREGTFECLELPEGGSALLGVIPLEMLGLEPDLQSQTLRVLPSETVNTYLTIL